MGDVLDVEAAGRDVGGDQDVQRPVAEAAHDPVALLLRQPAVERRRIAAPAGQRLSEVVHLAAGPGEHQRRGAVLEVEDPAQRSQLVRASHDVGDLAHSRRLARRGPFLLDADADRVVEVALREARDRARDRGREQGGLALPGQRGQDAVQVLREAHVQHLVCLVEDDDRDLVEPQRAAVEVVHGAARGRHHDIHAAHEARQLRGDRLAPVDGHDPHADLATVAVDRLGDLHRQLARGREHERGRAAAPAVARDAPAVRPLPCLARGVEPAGQRLEDRQREGGRLARAGGRLREQVAAGEERRDRGGLDGRWLLVAEGGDRPQQPRVQAERHEAGGGRAVGVVGRGDGLRGHGQRVAPIGNRPRASLGRHPPRPAGT